jgi:hypothetical protein
MVLRKIQQRASELYSKGHERPTFLFHVSAYLSTSGSQNTICDSGRRIKDVAKRYDGYYRSHQYHDLWKPNYLSEYRG